MHCMQTYDQIWRCSRKTFATKMASCKSNSSINISYIQGQCCRQHKLSCIKTHIKETFSPEENREKVKMIHKIKGPMLHTWECYVVCSVIIRDEKNLTLAAKERVSNLNLTIPRTWANWTLFLLMIAEVIRNEKYSTQTDLIMKSFVIYHIHSGP